MRTVPPPQMVEAMALARSTPSASASPRGSVAVERGVADLIRRARDLAVRPGKVLAAKRDWLVAEPDIAARAPARGLAGRAVVGDPRNAITIAELLGRADYLDLSPEIIERPLRGRLVINGRGEQQVGPASSSSPGRRSPLRSQAV